MTATSTLTAGVWQADVRRSTASFEVGNLGRGVHGTVPVTAGTVEIGVDGALLAVHGTLDLGSIATGNARRDLDLRKPNLLDLDRHPTMTFHSTSTRADGSGWHVTGTLSARGAATELDGVVTVSSAEGAEAVLTATTRLDRRTLGVRAPRLLIGRYVDITVTAVVRPT
ncbi:YceI family protein [Lentzea sp. HUAS12]|uniref:YceI family protein n=1 Tax=Lentzea sp. HUAS12 TaxID=2951806 RepID=UPI00209CD9B5|nr:YceI family protein [Lentzea sp. HUAS12]USX55041.1 YceI family protein [Lentzea sp. HUAS12]